MNNLFDNFPFRIDALWDYFGCPGVQCMFCLSPVKVVGDDSGIDHVESFHYECSNRKCKFVLKSDIFSFSFPEEQDFSFSIFLTNIELKNCKFVCNHKAKNVAINRSTSWKIPDNWETYTLEIGIPKVMSDVTTVANNFIQSMMFL